MFALPATTKLSISRFVSRQPHGSAETGSTYLPIHIPGKFNDKMNFGPIIPKTAILQRELLEFLPDRDFHRRGITPFRYDPFVPSGPKPALPMNPTARMLLEDSMKR